MTSTAHTVGKDQTGLDQTFSELRVIRPKEMGSYLSADLKDGTSRSGKEMRMIASFIAFQEVTECHMRKPTLIPTMAVPPLV